MTDADIQKMIDEFLQAWNSRDVDMVASCYSENLVYRDPNTRGEITDQPSFRRYLKKLLSSWEMTWHEKEAFRAQKPGAWTFLWRADIRKPGGDVKVVVNGMDLVVIENGLIARNEVYFDRLALAPLFVGKTEAKDEGISDFLKLMDG